MDWGNLLYTTSSFITDNSLLFLKRLLLLCLHIINSFPAHILISGCDYYMPLTLLTVLNNEERTTLSNELLGKEDEVLLMRFE